jgi:2-haloacid dehalogenase
MAKHSDLPWDMVLGAEVVRHYKPLPAAYLDSVKLLGLKPEQCCMVAAHNSDLAHASSHGMQTAFVSRPAEYGPHQIEDLKAEADYSFIAQSFVELADQLDC